MKDFIHKHDNYLSGMKDFFHKYHKYLITLLVVLVVFLGLQVTIQNSVVQGTSMEPSFENGQRLIVSKISYKFDEVGRGDVVIIRPPFDINVEYIKRVIGLPGETVEIKNGLVYINGEPISEPYILDPPNYTMNKIEVPEGYCFILGDNRNNSNDSHIFGPIPEDSIIGKAWLSIWPPSDWGIIHN